jgi:DnaJ-class molecular chaperone
MMAFIEVHMIGKKESGCSENETVCPTCLGSTVGDFGQPFECETCQGTGSIPLFERIRY